MNDRLRPRTSTPRPRGRSRSVPEVARNFPAIHLIPRRPPNRPTRIVLVERRDDLWRVGAKADVAWTTHGTAVGSSDLFGNGTSRPRRTWRRARRSHRLRRGSTHSACVCLNRRDETSPVTLMNETFHPLSLREVLTHFPNDRTFVEVSSGLQVGNGRRTSGCTAD